MAYVSEFTHFIAQLKTARPHLEAEQQKGRALLWDKPLDFAAQKAALESAVAQKPYAYQTN